ncbi:hypothetical protein ACTHPH_04835 [Paenibacillus pasadenensis]|uniref:hypothetical protein n=1 Tax=Paenibacillus pasadenensis TaxID=217090 RepID=UPI00040535B2|nr:hypothetical protein [Paenibacillus pasadenensis]
MKPVQASQTYPRLTVYSEERYGGVSRIYRGNLGIRDTDRILDGFESLRFFSTSPNATLVVFSETRFRGNYRVYRGSVRNLPDLDDLIGGEDVESLISTNQSLTDAQIREIRRTGSLPAGYRLL